jgi:outer membrane protein assembly factor BamA
MRCRAILQASIALGFVALPFSSLASGQVPSCAQCLSPYPQFATEINQVKTEATAVKISIVDIRFEGLVHLSRAAIQDLVKKEEQLELDAGDDWVESFENRIRDVWQRQGYFRVEVDAKPNLVSSDSMYERYSMTVHVAEGLKYRLGNVRFVPANPRLTANGFAFPVAQLRKQFNLREGDLFDVGEIRHGVEALTKLYGSDGYIDFTAVPQFDMNDADRRIALTVRLAEQMQYRVGKVEVEGLDPTMERILRSTIKEGEVFNTRLLNDFYEKYKLDLPESIRPETMATIDRNLENGKVNLRFDFRTCPEPGN